MSLSDWDREYIEEILRGKGNWFTARLLRLIFAVEPATRQRIAAEFPEEVQIIETATHELPGFMLHLTHLVQQANSDNRARLRRCFPEEVAAIEKHYGLSSATTD